MRDVLLSLLGAPIDVSVNVDQTVAAVVRPGDTVLVVPDAASQRSLQINNATKKFVDKLSQALPGVQVHVLFDCDRVLVVPSATGAGEPR